MPLTAVELLASNLAVATTLSLTPSRDIQVGEFIVVPLTQRNNSVTSLADNSSQAGTANTYTLDSPSSQIAGDGFAYIYSCKVTRKILSTDSITFTLGGSGAITGAVLALPDANASSQKDQTALAAVGTGTTYSSGSVATTAQADEYAIGVAAFAASGVEAGTITADSPWTLQFSQGGAIGYGSAIGSRVLTATGTPAFTGGWGASQDGEGDAAIVTYKGTPSGGGGTTINSSPSGTVYLDGSATRSYSSGSVINSSPSGVIQVCGNALVTYSRVYSSSPQGTLFIGGSASRSLTGGSTTINSSPDGTVILGGFANSQYSNGVAVFHPAIHGGWF
jgi:hypothetical protein